MSINRWSKEDIEFAQRKYLDKVPICEIAVLLNRTESATKKQLTKLGIRAAYKPWTTKDINEFYKLFAMGLPYKEIATRLNRTIKSIQSQVRDLGLKRNRSWTEADKQILLNCLEQGMYTKEIAEILERTYAATADAIKRYRKDYQSQES